MYLIEIEYWCPKEERSAVSKSYLGALELKVLHKLGEGLKLRIEKIEEVGFVVKNVNVELFEETSSDYAKFLQEKGRRD